MNMNQDHLPQIVTRLAPEADAAKPMPRVLVVDDIFAKVTFVTQSIGAC